MARLIKKLKQAITNYDIEGTAISAKQALIEGLAPIDILKGTIWTADA